MKKAFKIIGIVVLIIIVILGAIPFVLESKIDDIVDAYVKKNVNADVTFDDVSLSLLSSFPNANVTVDNLKIVNRAPFQDETFATSKSIALKMPIKELFKNSEDDPIVIKAITADEFLITLKENEAGVTNWDILIENQSSTDSTSGGFSYDIEDYKISNSAVTYIDEKSATQLFLTRLNHSGKGTFTDTTSELDTASEADISLRIDSTYYLENNQLTLDAIFGIDQNNNIYSFKENKGYINQLPLEFEGFVQQKDDGQLIDIAFKNPESSFKAFLEVLPEAYSKNVDNVETSGEFTVNGTIKGLLSEETIPTIDINMMSDNASFKYPDLPKRVENITINATIKNTTGRPNDTYVDLKTLNFKIDQDVFRSSATLRNLSDNVQVNADINGTLNLANISRAYPIAIDKELSGILKGQLNTSFDMDAVRTNAYARIKNNGSISITDFIFTSKDIVNPIHISNAAINFTPGAVTLNSFNAKTGRSDISATGSLQNLIGFLLNETNLQGNFNVNSNTFVVSDFMVENTSSASQNTTSNASKSLKIPEFLDCTINANANTVVYDNLNLKNVTGTLYIKNQSATLKNLTSNLFDGTLAVFGDVTTSGNRPTFNINLGADAFDVAQSFSDMELLQTLAPIAKAIQGKLNTTIKLSGQLNDNFSPDISTISGNALAEILTTSVNPLQGEVLEKLGGALNFIDFSKLDLKDLKTSLTFDNGLVNVKPFDFKYKDIAIVVAGSHGFDKSLNYNVTFDVPAKYLGSEVNRLIGKINDAEVNTISIPVVATITGSYNNPKVSTDLSSGVTKLTQQLIEIEKQKLIGKGKDKIRDLLGGLVKKDDSETSDGQPDGNPTETDTTTTKIDSTVSKPTDPIKDGVRDLLGGLINKKKKEKTQKVPDSTKN